jgi:hypothetical protein
MSLLHDRLGPDRREDIMPTAMIEIEVGRNQQIDVRWLNLQFGETGNDIIFWPCVVAKSCPGVRILRADHRLRIAGVD